MDDTRLFKRQCLDYINEMLLDIQSLNDHIYILDDENLEALHIRKAEPLDVDEDSVDFGPRFFTPRFTLEEARRTTVEFVAEQGRGLSRGEWPKRCRRGSYVGFWEEDSPGPFDPEERHPLCNPQTDAENRLEWFFDVMGASYFDWRINSSNQGVWKGSCWRGL